MSEFIQSRYPGFDWFAATIFLIFNGNVEKSWHFLHKFSSLGSSGYLWPHRLHCSVSNALYLFPFLFSNFYVYFIELSLDTSIYTGLLKSLDRLL